MKHPARLWRHLMTPHDVETAHNGIVRRTLMGDSALVCLLCQWKHASAEGCFFRTDLEATLHMIARHDG